MSVIEEIAAERERQKTVEGWTEEHDDRHSSGEMALAASLYAKKAAQNKFDHRHGHGSPPPEWPWSARWWKPKNCRRDLICAGALIVAEIERLDRAHQQPNGRTG